MKPKSKGFGGRSLEYNLLLRKVTLALVMFKYPKYDYRRIAKEEIIYAV